MGTIGLARNRPKCFLSLINLTLLSDFSVFDHVEFSHSLTNMSIFRYIVLLHVHRATVAQELESVVH